MSKVLPFIIPTEDEQDTFAPAKTRENYDYDSMILTFAQSDELIRDHTVESISKAGTLAKSLNKKASELRQAVKAMHGTRSFADGTTGPIVRLTKNV